MIWILIFLVGGIPSTEFAGEQACEAARVRIMAVYDRRTVCIAKGDEK
jgi:hypothetical protein